MVRLKHLLEQARRSSRLPQAQASASIVAAADLRLPSFGFRWIKSIHDLESDVLKDMESQVSIPGAPPGSRAVAQNGEADSRIPTNHFTDPALLILPLKALKTSPFPEGVDPRNRELYLSESSFLQLFGVTKDEWKVLPTWRKVNMKLEQGLF